MSPELAGIITVGIALFSANLAMAGVALAFNNHWENQHRHRMSRYDDPMRHVPAPSHSESHSGIDSLRSEMNQGFAQKDARIRNLEQGQAHVSGQFFEFKDYLNHWSESASDSQTGDNR